MRKKILPLVLCLVLALSCAVTFSACNDETIEYVILGDSIAEAVIGPSPLSERENYGYYGVLGQRNEYEFFNRSISGNKVAQMLDVVSATEEGANLTISHIKSADVIQISILGNDLLQNDLGELIVQMADEEYDDINAIIADAGATFAQVIAKLKELNPNAAILMQTVYNPVYEGCTTVAAKYIQQLNERGYDTWDEIHVLADQMLDKLNGIPKNYLTEHPGDFYIVDVYQEFERLRTEDINRASGLFYADWVHPSNEGHAVIADLTQAKLEELELANHKTAISNYRDLRIEQLERMFADTVDVTAVKKAIKKADSCAEITKIYFDAIDGKLPVYC